ncbi:MAG: hypothetical protein HY902_09790, partial [Deltaproteobacteria bacterium]|nr:hypothetical protein [Deltaproteobacteria bacterium]
NPCNDNDACTTGDVCSGGKCAGPGSLDCDDGNPCSNDSCDKSNGCQHVNNTVACNDSDACTTGDVCSGGKCGGPSALNCDDNNVCTNDSCDKAQGCLHANNTLGCNDNDACTSGDQCSGGACSGAAITCDDKNDCTVDTCNKSTGCVFTNAAAGTACNDGNVCTVGDSCLNSVCKPGNQVWVDVLAGQIPNPNSGAGGGSLTDGSGAGAKFNTPTGLAYMPYDQKLYVADTYNHAIRAVTLDGKVSTVAGGAYAGFVDGTGSGAQFNMPTGVAAAGKGNLYVVDSNNHALRLLDTSAGSVTTLAGGSEGFTDGGGAKEAQFAAPMGIAVNLAGLVAIADSGNHAIRIYNPGTGEVSTLAGTGSPGSGDSGTGTGGKATFNKPVALAFDGNGVLFVVDMNNHKLRKVTPAGVVSTVAGDGKAGLVDSTNLSAVEFNYPSGIALSSWGPMFVTDSYNGRVRRAGPNGVATLAGGGNSVAPAPALQSSFNMPGGVTADASGYLYIADSNNHLLRRIRDTGNPCTIGGVCYTNGLIAANEPCKSCQGGTSFSVRPTGSACYDGLLCTSGETCASTGACSGQTLNCNDGNVCTDDACDAMTGGTCTATVNVATCSDGNPCTVGESCMYGECTVPTGSNACDDKNPCTTDSCTVQGGAAACAHSALGPETVCTAPAGSAYGMCRNAVCTGVEQTTIAATGGAATRLLDVNPDMAGGITAVGHAVSVNNTAPFGAAIAVTTGSTPPTLATQWSSTEELWSIRGRLLTGGHATIGGSVSDAASYTAYYTGNPAYTSGGPALSAISRVLRSTAMAIDGPTGGEDYLSGGAGDGTSLSPPTTLYRFRYLPASGTWDVSNGNKLGEMGVAGLIPSTSLGCTPAMVNVDVNGIYRPSTTEAFVALYGAKATTGYVAYWNAQSSLNTLCNGVAPGGTVDLTANNTKLLVVSGAQLLAVDGSAGTNVLAVGTSASSSSPVIWSFNGTTWSGQYPSLKAAGLGTAWSNTVFVPQAVAVLEKEAFVAGYVPLSGCRYLFVLHGSRSGTSWAWDHLKVTNNTVYTCDSANAGRLTITRGWANPKDGAVYFTGSAATASNGSTIVAAGQSSTGQVGLLLRIK